MPGRVRAWGRAMANGLLAAPPAPSCATWPGPAAIRVTTATLVGPVSRARPRLLPPMLRVAVGLLRQGCRGIRRPALAPIIARPRPSISWLRLGSVSTFTWKPSFCRVVCTSRASLAGFARLGTLSYLETPTMRATRWAAQAPLTATTLITTAANTAFQRRFGQRPTRGDDALRMTSTLQPNLHSTRKSDTAPLANGKPADSRNILFIRWKGALGGAGRAGRCRAFPPSPGGGGKASASAPGFGVLNPRLQVLDDGAGVEGPDVVGGLGPLLHHDLGRGLETLDGADIDAVGPEGVAPEGIPAAPAIAAAVIPPRRPQEAVGSVPGPVEGIGLDVGLGLLVGVAVDDGEPVVAALDRQLGGAEEEIPLHRLAAGQRVAP